jgi:hypothetical protein
MKDVRESVRSIAAEISSGGSISQGDIDILKAATRYGFVAKEVLDVVTAILRRIDGAAHGAAMLGGQDRMLQALLNISALASTLSLGIGNDEPEPGPWRGTFP